jgi:16S rRNA G527 N7-methylase RsmG
MNLTAVNGEKEIVTRHFLDSLALFQIEGLKGSRIIDVGPAPVFRASR